MRACARQLLRFAVVGAAGTACHYAVLIVAVGSAEWSPVAASSFGALIGASINYTLNRRYTFRSTVPNRQALPKFLAVAVLGLIINAAAMLALTAGAVNYLAAQFIATALVLVVGFACNRAWTFTQDKKSDDESTELASQSDLPKGT